MNSQEGRYLNRLMTRKYPLDRLNNTRNPEVRISRLNIQYRMWSLWSPLQMNTFRRNIDCKMLNRLMTRKYPRDRLNNTRNPEVRISRLNIHYRMWRSWSPLQMHTFRWDIDCKMLNLQMSRYRRGTWNKVRDY